MLDSVAEKDYTESTPAKQKRGEGEAIPMTEISSDHIEAELKELGVTNHNLNLLKFLIGSQEDLEDFVENYWQGSRRQFFSVCDYRKKRIEQNHLSYESFVSAYEANKQLALEHLFAHPVDKHDINVLEKAIAEGTLTLTQLYHTHIEEPSAVLLAVVPH